MGAQTKETSPVPLPAAPIPSHVLSREQAGSLTLAEQGDLIEVRLAEQAPATGTWRLLHQLGSGRVEALGQPALTADKSGAKRVFRFRAVEVGSLELVFAYEPPNTTPRPAQVVAFRLVIQ